MSEQPVPQPQQQPKFLTPAEPGAFPADAGDPFVFPMILNAIEGVDANSILFAARRAARAMPAGDNIEFRVEAPEGDGSRCVVVLTRTSNHRRGQSLEAAFLKILKGLVKTERPEVELPKRGIGPEQMPLVGEVVAEVINRGIPAILSASPRLFAVSAAIRGVPAGDEGNAIRGANLTKMEDAIRRGVQEVLAGFGVGKKDPEILKAVGDAMVAACTPAVAGTLHSLAEIVEGA